MPSVPQVQLIGNGTVYNHEGPETAPLEHPSQSIPRTARSTRPPCGPQQVCRYDDSTGDELPVLLGTTAFVSGKTMFGMLPRELLTGLAIESEGKEYAPRPAPAVVEEKALVFPVTWKNPGVSREGVLHADAAHLMDLKEVRDLLYKMQWPAIAPSLVYPHGWKEEDLVLFHIRGVPYTVAVVGVFKPDQVRAFHRCNLVASSIPVGPTPENVRKFA
ncbi:hypothetical protein EI94DRAFT_1794268 [Lactarius quietus]|nr:hypothetical protein EI94DRAFT_1794268 [Lactarius quietus]